MYILVGVGWGIIHGAGKILPLQFRSPGFQAECLIALVITHRARCAQMKSVGFYRLLCHQHASYLLLNEANRS